VPHSLRFWQRVRSVHSIAPRNKLERRYGQRQLHFITCSCYRRLPFLRSAPKRDVLLKILHNVREKYHFSLVGYVVMPEHIHILISEPKIGTPGTVMQVFKQRVSRALRMKTRPRNANQLSLWKNAPHLHAKHFWQRRFYDFNVWSARKRIEKLHYMHRNPVKRGLVNDPKLWLWSSYRFYQYDENNICTPDREPRYGIEEAKAKSTSQHTHPSQNEGCAAQKPKA
jgi:putative transposase